MTSDVKISPVASATSSQRHGAVPQPNQTPLSLGHGRVWNSFEKMGEPVNKWFNKVGTEAFWPSGLEEESEKAARILRSFCKEGIEPGNDIKSEKDSKPVEVLPEYPSEKNDPSVNEKTPLAQSEPRSSSPPLPPRPQKSLLKIPSSVIQNALGLAIFTSFRLGGWGTSLSAGSGVLIAREPNTQKWSSPSALGVSTLGFGFTGGIDVIDCVVVINTVEALERFKSMRLSLGGDVGLTLGPWGAGGAADYGLGRSTQPIALQDAGAKKKGKCVGKPVYIYTKSKGLYAGLSIDGTVIGVRSDENARFYGEKVEVNDILSGHVKRWTALDTLLEDLDYGARNVKVGLEEQIREAPLLLEFIDRRGQRRGSDGVWVDVAPEVDAEEKRRQEEKELEEKLERKKAEEAAWIKRDTFA